MIGRTRKDIKVIFEPDPVAEMTLCLQRKMGRMERKIDDIEEARK